MRWPSNQTALTTRQEICAAAEGRGDPRAALQGTSETSGSRALHHSRLRSSAARRKGAGRGAQLRVARAVGARTRCTCRRTRSRASACGRNRSTPIAGRQRRHARRTRHRKSCTRWTIRRTRTCRSRRTAAARRVAAEARGAAATAGSSTRPARRRPAWPACMRRRPFPRGTRSSAARGPKPPHCRRASTTFPHTDAITHFARALGAARSGNPEAGRRRHRTARGAPRRAENDAGRVLGGAGGHPAAGRASHGSHSRTATRPRGIEQLRAAAAAEDAHRQIGGLAGPARAGARAARLYAARGRSARRGTRRVRGHDQERAEPFPRSHTERRGPQRQPASAHERIALYKQLLQVASEPDTNRPELQHARNFGVRLAPRQPGRRPRAVLAPGSRTASTPRARPHHQRRHRRIGRADRHAEGRRRERLLAALVRHPRAALSKCSCRSSLRGCAIVERMTTLEALNSSPGTAPPRVVAALVLAVHVFRAGVSGRRTHRRMRPHLPDRWASTVSHELLLVAHHGVRRAVCWSPGRYKVVEVGLDGDGRDVHAQHDRRDDRAAVDALSGRLRPNCRRPPSFTLPASFTVAFAAFGIIGVGASELIYYPYWCLEKGYARHIGAERRLGRMAHACSGMAARASH